MCAIVPLKSGNHCCSFIEFQQSGCPFKKGNSRRKKSSSTNIYLQSETPAPISMLNKLYIAFSAFRVCFSITAIQQGFDFIVHLWKDRWRPSKEIPHVLKSNVFLFPGKLPLHRNLNNVVQEDCSKQKVLFYKESWFLASNAVFVHSIDSLDTALYFILHFWSNYII